MRRRTFLASAAAGIAALTGCLGDPPDGPPEETPVDGTVGTDGESGTDDGTSNDSVAPADRVSPTPGTPADADVTVESLVLQYGVVTPSSPDSIGVSFSDTPYVVASVTVDGSLARDDFVVTVGDQRVAPTVLDDFYRTYWGDEEWYEQGAGSGLILFELPTDASGEPELHWPGGERAVGESAAERLERGPPQFSAQLDVPETHDGGNVPLVKVEVTNDADVPARFVGALNRVGPMIAYTPVDRLNELVPAGETATIHVDDDWGDLSDSDRIGDDEPDVTYHLHWGSGEDSAEIRIVESA